MNPILALIFANIIWGAAPPIFKLALTNIPPFTLAFLRFFLASFFFLPFAFKHSWRMLRLSEWGAIILSAFLGITLNIIFFFLGLQLSPSINASVIASAAPIFIFFLSVPFLHEKIKSKQFFGMVVAFFGILILVFSPFFLGQSFLAESQVWIGNLYLIGAMLSAVFSSILVKKFLEKLNIFVILYFSFLFSSVTFLPFMLKELVTWQITQINFAGLFGILYGVIGSSALAYGLYYFGLSKVTAHETGIFTYIDPIATVIVAIPLLNEYPTVYYFISLFLVAIGIYICEGRVHYHPIRKMWLWFKPVKVASENAIFIDE